MSKKMLIKKNCSVKVPKTWYIYVSEGSLSIGGIKFWGKVARGGVPLSAPEPVNLNSKILLGLTKPENVYLSLRYKRHSIIW